ncbi:hypothetical protein EG68_11568 [Paragonimus skrjabini miyazakii]|uniref:Protein-serine/threonine kinase n=1 Tax=Paragonimus skrjabini miyazakii TaxID=59628 RepID=A0A8S9YEJ6_9TREM|nr:hypothetical protein EG68_11568 [Paragonimus skrjabini miyazakii]
MKLDRFGELIGKAAQKFEPYSAYRPTPLNLKSLVQFGKTAAASKSFAFLKKELPIRIASMLKEVRCLPGSFLRTNAVLKIAQMYDDMFETLLKYEKCSPDRPSVISEFTDDLQTIIQRNSDVVALMAIGIKEMKERQGFSSDEEKWLDYFLDRFYISRIGIRTLMTQHTLLYGPVLRETESHIGCIDPECSPLRLAVTAYSYARLICSRVYGRSPGCNIHVLDCVSDKMCSTREFFVSVDDSGQPSESCELFDQLPSCAGLRVHGRDVTFCYIPGHLFHALFELYKNAMRAVMERWADESDLPELQMVICLAPEDLTIKLCDRGGGMARHIADQAFKYTFTTAAHLAPSVDISCSPDGTIHETLRSGQTELNTDPENATYSPLAGRGHGLPLSRLYTRYLSGDLRLISVEGYGTTSFIHLKHLPEAANELLPIFSRTSQAVYEHQEVDCDWITGNGFNRSAHFVYPSH